MIDIYRRFKDAGASTVVAWQAAYAYCLDRDLGFIADAVRLFPKVHPRKPLTDRCKALVQHDRGLASALRTVPGCISYKRRK